MLWVFLFFALAHAVELRVLQLDPGVNGFGILIVGQQSKNWSFCLNYNSDEEFDPLYPGKFPAECELNNNEYSSFVLIQANYSTVPGNNNVNFGIYHAKVDTWFDMANGTSNEAYNNTPNAFVFEFVLSDRADYVALNNHTEYIAYIPAFKRAEYNQNLTAVFAENSISTFGTTLRILGSKEEEVETSTTFTTFTSTQPSTTQSSTETSTIGSSTQPSTTQSSTQSSTETSTIGSSTQSSVEEAKPKTSTESSSQSSESTSDQPSTTTQPSTESTNTQSNTETSTTGSSTQSSTESTNTQSSTQQPSTTESTRTQQSSIESIQSSTESSETSITTQSTETSTTGSSTQSSTQSNTESTPTQSSTETSTTTQSSTTPTATEEQHKSKLLIGETIHIGFEDLDESTLLTDLTTKVAIIDQLLKEAEAILPRTAKRSISTSTVTKKSLPKAYQSTPISLNTIINYAIKASGEQSPVATVSLPNSAIRPRKNEEGELMELLTNPRPDSNVEFVGKEENFDESPELLVFELPPREHSNL